MRNFIDLVEGNATTEVLALIDRAGFTADEVESGTGGFCAMFALALYRATLAMQPTLVLVCQARDGVMRKTRKGEMWWRHAAVEIDGRYYDIEGEQQPEWLINNYVWGGGDEGCIVPLTPEEFIKQVRTTPASRDWRFYTKCKQRFNQIAV